MLKDRIRTTRNALDVRNGRRGWFKFEAKADVDETEISIYDEIGFFGITSKEFVAELRNVRTSAISLHLNSPGGDVFDGIAIYNALKQHPATVNVTVDAIAASIASVIAMGGDTVRMADGAMMMIHKPFAMTIGDDDDHEKGRDALRAMGRNIAGIYALRAGGDVEDWLAAMAKESWYDGEEAVDAGLADEVFAVLKPVKNTFDLSIFRNAPKNWPAEPTRAEPGDAPAEVAWQRAARLKVASAAMEVHRVSTAA